MYAINRTGDTAGQFNYFRTEHQLLPIRPFPQAKIQTTRTLFSLHILELKHSVI